jgi:hypothetical protein
VDADKEYVDLEKMLIEVKEDLADAIAESKTEISLSACHCPTSSMPG